MKNKSLTAEEETKIDRLGLLLTFLGKKQIINFVATGPFRFEPETGSFHDDITDRIVAPNENMIDLFYRRLCRDAMSKLQVDLKRTKIKGFQRLLVAFYKLDFLPLAF